MEDKKEVIINYLTAIRKQNNRSTRFPYFYVIRTEEWIPSDTMSGEGGPGDSEKTVWIKIHDPEEEFDSYEEAIQGVMSEQDVSRNDAVLELENEFEEVRIARIWRHRGMFLTETDADNHLRKNNYHYSSNAHTYIDYAFRAHELEDFFKALFEHFDIKEPWYSRTTIKTNGDLKEIPCKNG